MDDFFVDRLPNGTSSNGDGASVIPRKVQRQWREVTQKLCLAQAVVGPIWMLIATIYLHGDSRMHSQIVGLIMLGVGAAGYYGLASRRVHFLMFHFVVTSLGMMLIVQELSKIEMQLKFHCTAAFTMVKVSHLETHLQELKQDEMFTAVYSRMNEIDDMLELYAKGDGGASPSKSSNMGADQFYIQAKLARLKRHAQQVVHELQEKEAQLRGTAQPGDPGYSLELEKQMRQAADGMRFAERVVARLTPRDGEDLAPLTYAEYSGVLEMLQSQLAAALGGDNASSSVEENLEAESAQLPLLKSTWNRVEEGRKSKRGAAAVQAEKQQRRQRWEAEFQAAFGVDQESGTVSRPSIQQRMSSAMEELPQMCMEETRAWYGFEVFGWLLIIFQAGVAYCILANLFQNPIKVD